VNTEIQLAEDDPIYLELIRQRDAALTLYEKEISDLRAEIEQLRYEVRHLRLLLKWIRDAPPSDEPRWRKEIVEVLVSDKQG
jgi:hypothetical protein